MADFNRVLARSWLQIEVMGSRGASFLRSLRARLALASDAARSPDARLEQQKVLKTAGAHMTRSGMTPFSLERLPDAAQRKAPLQGQKVLVLGTAYAPLCRDAVKQGAAKVVLLHAENEEPTAYVQTAEGVEVLAGDLDALGAERFDVIFLPHAQERADLGRFLDRLSHLLRPKGVLILEVACHRSASAMQWRVVTDEAGTRRYPSYGLIKTILLRDWAFRRVGTGVLSNGDDMTQMIFHCTPLQPTALIITGMSGHGKSNLLRFFDPKSFPAISTDSFLSQLARNKGNSECALVRRIKAEIGSKPANWGLVGRMIAADGQLTEAFCATLVASCPLEARLFILEGEILRHDILSERLTQHLNAQNVRVWKAMPSAL